MPSPVRVFRWGINQVARFFPIGGSQKVNEKDFVTRKSFEDLKQIVNSKLNADPTDSDDEGVFDKESGGSPGLEGRKSISLQSRIGDSTLTEDNIAAYVRSIVREEMGKSKSAPLLCRSVGSHSHSGEEVRSPIHSSGSSSARTSGSNLSARARNLGTSSAQRSPATSNPDLATSWISLESSNGDISSTRIGIERQDTMPVLNMGVSPEKNSAHYTLTSPDEREDF
jgi:hypothetical protein